MRSILFVFLISLFSTSAFSSAVEEAKVRELANLTRAIMEAHEKYLGIAYGDNFPVISISVGMNENYLAKYNSERQEILLNRAYFSKCNFYFLRKNLNEGSFEDWSCGYKRLRSTLSHELGHYYTHIKILSGKPDSWLAKQYNTGGKWGLESFADRMVIEGIAEVFGDVFGDRTKAKVADVVWTRYTRGEMDERVAVDWFLDQGGHAIVRPILDAQGYDSGIEWILEHPVELKLLELYSEQLIDWTPVLKYRVEGAKVGLSSFLTAL
jgi:hypothetical protein